MKDYSNTKGRLKPNFHYKNLLKKMEDTKMLTTQPVFINNDDIKRILKSKKVLVGELGIGNELLSINREFGKLNNFETKDFCFCEKTLQMFLIQNEINETTVTETVAISTFRNGNSYSIGLYYIPEGNIDNICLVARVCDHNGFNEHKNKMNSVVVGKYETHIHMLTEEYEKFVFDKYKNDQEKLLNALRAPDAFVIKKVPNIKVMQNYAEKLFNVTNQKISCLSDVFQEENYVVSHDNIVETNNHSENLLTEIQKELKNLENNMEM